MKVTSIPAHVTVQLEPDEAFVLSEYFSDLTNISLQHHIQNTPMEMTVLELDLLSTLAGELAEKVSANG